MSVISNEGSMSERLSSYSYYESMGVRGAGGDGADMKKAFYLM
jgi:hypothetical protein